MSWFEIVKSLFIGLAFGTVVALGNHWLIWSVIKNYEHYDPKKAKTKVMVRYLLRYAVDALALFLVYKHLYILVGTAFGLTLVGKVLAAKYTFLKRR